MKERKLMTSFMVGNVVDVALTGTALSMSGFSEVGIMGSGLIESGRLDQAAMIRTGVTAMMIAFYALAKETGSKLTFTLERSLQISNTIAWSVNVLTTAQIIYEMLPKG